MALPWRYSIFRVPGVVVAQAGGSVASSRTVNFRNRKSRNIGKRAMRMTGESGPGTNLTRQILRYAPYTLQLLYRPKTLSVSEGEDTGTHDRNKYCALLF